MRIDRKNLWLGAILAVVVGANLLIGGEGRASIVGAPLVAGFDPARAARIWIEEQGVALELVRPENGWTVVQRRGFPAHAGAVQDLLQRVRGLSTTDLVANEAASHALYGIDDGAPRLAVFDGQGAALARLQISRPQEGATGSYVVLDGAEAVYRAPGLPPVTADPVRWLDTRLLDFDPTRVRSLRVARMDQSAELRLVRGADGRWRILGGTVSLPPAVVDPLLLTAANLYFLDVADGVPDEASGLEPPRLMLALELEDGALARLHLGTEGDGGRYATSPGWKSPWVVLLPESSARRLEVGVERIAAGAR